MQPLYCGIYYATWVWLTAINMWTLEIMWKEIISSAASHGFWLVRLSGFLRIYNIWYLLYIYSLTEYSIRTQKKMQQHVGKYVLLLWSFSASRELQCTYSVQYVHVLWLASSAGTVQYVVSLIVLLNYFI